MNNIRVRNVQELVDYLNDIKNDKLVKFIVCGHSIGYVDDKGSKYTVIEFTNDKQGVIKRFFYNLEEKIQSGIYQFMVYVDRDDWFAEFGIHEFEELCREINNSYDRRLFTCDYRKGRVMFDNLMIGGSSFVFFTDGKVKIYELDDVNVLNILHDFIKNNDIKKIFQENVDFMEVQ